MSLDQQALALVPTYNNLLITANPPSRVHSTHPVSTAMEGMSGDGPTSSPRLTPLDASLPSLLSQAHDLALASLAAATVRLSAAEKSLVDLADLTAVRGAGVNDGSGKGDSGNSESSGSRPLSSPALAAPSPGPGAGPNPRIRVLRPLAAATTPTTLTSTPQPTPSTNTPIPGHTHTHAPGTMDENCPTCGQTLTLDARLRRETEVRQSLVGLRTDKQRLQVIMHPINTSKHTILLHSFNTACHTPSQHILSIHTTNSPRSKVRLPNVVWTHAPALKPFMTNGTVCKNGRAKCTSKHTSTGY